MTTWIVGLPVVWVLDTDVEIIAGRSVSDTSSGSILDTVLELELELELKLGLLQISLLPFTGIFRFKTHDNVSSALVGSTVSDVD